MTNLHRFLGRIYAKMPRRFFSPEDSAGKTGHFSGIPAGAGILGGILPGSQYLFYN